MSAWFNCFRERAERLRKRQREEGFDYAAGRLLRGVPMADVLAESDPVFDRNDFERGMRDALDAWAKLVEAP